jgi:peroxiredoxin-like protein
MEPKKTYRVFRYETDVRWKSGRRAALCSPGKPNLEASSPPEFKGEAGLWTPEDLFVASVNLCTLMTFAAFAERKGLEFADYECAAEGVLEFVDSKYRFTEIILHPHVSVKSQADVEPAREILDAAHRNCLVSNSITATVKIFPDIRVVTAAA